MATRHPLPPTSSLPPLARLATYSTEQITEAIDNLRFIYCPQALSTLPRPKALPKHLVHDTSVPDSGYASAEGEDDSEDESEDEDTSFDIDVLQADSFEREFAIRWLTGFTARSDVWVYSVTSDEETDARAALVDSAASVIATFAGKDEEEALTRTFAFPTGSGAGANCSDAVHVELNDAALLSDDHTSVGLQSWGSSIRLAERMCLDPGAFGLSLLRSTEPSLRILELGAGTGLLSVVVAKLLAPNASMEPPVKIIATDYHPSVLDNLRENVSANFPSSSACPIDVLPLDWQSPVYEGPFATHFDVILAADVVYHPEHARWIKACVERLLTHDSCSVFWLIIPLRPTGRHAGMSDTVEAVFPRVSQVRGKELAILGVEELAKQGGVGRADEGGYKLYKVGWA